MNPRFSFSRNISKKERPELKENLISYLRRTTQLKEGDLTLSGKLKTFTYKDRLGNIYLVVIFAMGGEVGIIVKKEK